MVEIITQLARMYRLQSLQSSFVYGIGNTPKHSITTKEWVKSTSSTWGNSENFIL